MARGFSSDNNNILEALATGEPALAMQEIYDGAGVCIEQDMLALHYATSAKRDLNHTMNGLTVANHLSFNNIAL